MLPAQGSSHRRKKGVGMAREEGLTLRGSPVRSLPRRNRVWARNRVCAEEGCTTKISMYNKSRYCWTHDPVRYYIPRGRKKRRQAA